MFAEWEYVYQAVQLPLAIDASANEPRCEVEAPHQRGQNKREAVGEIKNASLKEHDNNAAVDPGVFRDAIVQFLRHPRHLNGCWGVYKIGGAVAAFCFIARRTFEGDAQLVQRGGC